MRCRLCELDLPLIEAHIIPKPFFTAFGDEKHPSKSLSNVPGERPKRVRTGFYDSRILCATCDGRLGAWDQYGIELFLHQLSSFQRYPNTASAVALARADFDYARLRLFLLSVLWRAHITSHPIFDKVRLGPFAEPLRRLIHEGNPGDPDTFSMVLSVFTVNGTLPPNGVPIMDPFRERWSGVNAYRLSFGIVTAYIKVDQSRLPPALRKMALSPGSALFLLTRDFTSSSEAKVARAVARHRQNNHAFRGR